MLKEGTIKVFRSPRFAPGAAPFIMFGEDSEGRYYRLHVTELHEVPDFLKDRELPTTKQPAEYKTPATRETTTAPKMLPTRENLAPVLKRRGIRVSPKATEKTMLGRLPDDARSNFILN